MVSIKIIASLFLAALPLGTAAGSALSSGEYIITLKDGATLGSITSHIQWVKGVHARSDGRRDLHLLGLDKVFDIGNFKAYAGTFDTATIEEIRNNPVVAHVEKAKLWTLFGMTTQYDAPRALASISHRAPTTTEYIYDSSAGAGGYAYVIDSGVNIEHAEFQGRAVHGYTAVRGGDDVPDTDELGHGTHVAGTIASHRFGVAKRAAVVAVKAFRGRDASTAVILDAYRWAVGDIVARKRQARAVINMSFGGEGSAAYDCAVKSAYEMGVLTVAAAGNENTDCSGVSPARSPYALTVAAANNRWERWYQSNKWASNYGSPVDIYAPGEDIVSPWLGSAIKTKSGTSMAAPHVAGLALYLAVHENLNTPGAVKDRIKQLGTKGKIIGNVGNTTNSMSYNGNK